MSFSGASFGPPNGYHPQQDISRTFVETNGGHGPYSQGQDAGPQIYTVRYTQSAELALD